MLCNYALLVGIYINSINSDLLVCAILAEREGMKYKDLFIKPITEIANANLRKKYHSVSIKEWQTREILEAVDLYLEKEENEKMET